jgi:pimeloyl-ACP methyl ester carboxylesterase
MPRIGSMGTTLHFGDGGRGVPVIALHGSAATGAAWRTLVGCLEGRYRVITPDLMGYGRSGVPLRAHGLGAEAAFLMPLLAAAGEPVHLVGHSYGGAVALEIARRMPWAVRSLTLVEPVAFGLLRGREQDLFEEIGAVADTVASRAASGERAAAMAAFVDYWNGPGAWARSSPELQAFFDRCLDRVLANFAAVEAPGLDAGVLGRIACPALAVMGLRSPLPALRTTELVAEALPGARLVMVADAGHMLPLTDPHVLDPLVAEHLGRSAADVERAAA